MTDRATPDRRRPDRRSTRPSSRSSCRPPRAARSASAASAAARGQGPADVVLHARRRRPGRRRHRLPRRPGRDHGPRRRVRLRQERDQPVDHAPRRPARARSRRGEVLFDGQDLLKLPDDEMRKIRGDRISMIFQQPTSSLNPVWDVGRPDRRGAARSTANMKGKAARAPGARAAPDGRHPRPGAAPQGLSRTRCRAAWPSA